MSFFVCQKCRKRVTPKGKTISCCGITEKLDECVAENERYQASRRASAKRLEKEMSKLFDPVVAHWNEDDGEFNDYEGIPNS
jgi:hypothetical protein